MRIAGVIELPTTAQSQCPNPPCSLTALTYLSKNSRLVLSWSVSWPVGSIPKKVRLSQTNSPSRSVIASSAPFLARSTMVHVNKLELLTSFPGDNQSSEFQTMRIGEHRKAFGFCPGIITAIVVGLE